MSSGVRTAALSTTSGGSEEIPLVILTVLIGSMTVLCVCCCALCQWTSRTGRCPKRLQLLLPAGAGHFLEIKLVNLQQPTSGDEINNEKMALRTAAEIEPADVPAVADSLATEQPADLYAAVSTGLRHTMAADTLELNLQRSSSSGEASIQSSSSSTVVACPDSSLFPPGCDGIKAAQETDLSTNPHARGLRAVPKRIMKAIAPAQELGEHQEGSKRGPRFKRYQMCADTSGTAPRAKSCNMDAISDTASDAGSEMSAIMSGRESQSERTSKSNVVSHQRGWLIRQMHESELNSKEASRAGSPVALPPGLPPAPPTSKHPRAENCREGLLRV